MRREEDIGFSPVRVIRISKEDLTDGWRSKDIRLYVLSYYFAVVLLSNLPKIFKFEYAYLIGIIVGILFATADWKVVRCLLPRWITMYRAEKLENVAVVFSCGLFALFLLSYFDTQTPYSVLFQGYLIGFGYMGVLIFRWISNLPEQLNTLDRQNQALEQYGLSESTKHYNSPWLKSAGELLIATVVGTKASIFVSLFQPMNSDQKMQLTIMGGVMGFSAGLVLILYDVTRRGIARDKAAGKSILKWRFLNVGIILLVLIMIIVLCLIGTLFIY